MAQLSRPDSEFDRFLFASLLDQNGTFLTVLSALAQQGIDPWEEAERLARLPRDYAVNSLASTIWKVSSDCWTPSEASIAATKLVQLLPTQGGSRKTSSPLDAGEGNVLMWIIYGVVWGTIVLSGHGPRQSGQEVNTPPVSVQVAEQAPNPALQKYLK